MTDEQKQWKESVEAARRRLEESGQMPLFPEDFLGREGRLDMTDLLTKDELEKLTRPAGPDVAI